LSPGEGNGVVKPLTVKPVPDRDTWLIVIFGPPEFDNVTDCVLLLPTGTLPKLMLEGLTVSCPVPATACEPKARKVEKAGRICAGFHFVRSPNIPQHDLLCGTKAVRRGD
jgi:hypothetical protein